MKMEFVYVNKITEIFSHELQDSEWFINYDSAFKEWKHHSYWCNNHSVAVNFLQKIFLTWT